MNKVKKNISFLNANCKWSIKLLNHTLNDILIIIIIQLSIMADLHATVESCLKIFYFKEMEMVTKRKPEVFFSQHKL